MVEVPALEYTVIDASELECLMVAADQGYACTTVKTLRGTFV